MRSTNGAMIHRIVRFLWALVPALASLPGGAGAAPSPAADTVRGFYDVLLSVMQNGSALGEKGRYETLKPAVSQTFDLPYMTRAVVGPVWASTSESQHRQVTDAFGRYVAATYADRFDSYRGQKLEVTGEQPRAPGVIVDSRIVRADGTPVVIKYLMRQNGDGWRVADVYLQGTISEVATRRSEFSSILRSQGVDGLTASLDSKAEMLVSGASR